MEKVVILHAPTDQYFVNLLEALLKYHYFKTQCHIPDLSADVDIPQEIDALIMVITKNFLKFKFSDRENEIFDTQKNEYKTIPLFLDVIKLKSVKSKFKDSQPIDFTEGMLTGFQNLFSVLGKEFLPNQERRTQNERRYKTNQRKVTNRRESDMLQRMRTGFWKNYSLATGLSEYAELMLGVQQLITVKESLKDEASKYNYFDNDGKPCDVDSVLEESINNVWAEMSNRYYTSAANLIDYIIDDITKTYKVEKIDQRIRSNRRKIDGRRKTNNKSE